MTFPFTSLDGATATGPGEAYDLEGVRSYHSMVVTVEDYAGSGSVAVRLEYSHDGVNWATGVGGGYQIYQQVVEATGNQVSLATSSWFTASGSFVPLQVNVPCRYIRANLVALPSGGATVTATVASADDQ